MAYVHFALRGDIALWRNPHEPVGSFSSLGPAPSHLAGLIGAALGFASPRSVGTNHSDENELRKLQRKGLIWPVSPELLQWQRDYDYAVACKWCGQFPHRVQWHVNGYKTLSGADSADNLRLVQTVVESPRYDVLVRLNSRAAADEVASALLRPRFPLYLGTSFCRAIVEDVTVANDINEVVSDGQWWAYWVEELTIGEAVPLTRHVVNDRQTSERIASHGFWIYPTLAHPPPEEKTSADPCVTGYVEL